MTFAEPFGNLNAVFLNMYVNVIANTCVRLQTHPYIYQQYLKSPTQILKDSYTTPPTQYRPRSPINEETVSPIPLKLPPPLPPPRSGDGGEGEGHVGNTFVGLLQYFKTRRTVYIYEQMRHDLKYKTLIQNPAI